ncbi:unnamed protein product [Prunus armeniaca]
MEVEIISKEKIKPSCPTPSHLRIFKLSLLDQLIPAPYAPVILFYHPPINENDDDNINSRLHLLKTSLAETLTGIYPLAGEIKDDLSIDCNDQGAHYVEARVNYSSLDEFLGRPDLLLLLHRFLPCDVTTAGASVTNIQVNVFKCGGIAIGLCISHKILDGAALCTFLKSWTAIARMRSSTSSPGPGSLLRTSSSSSSSSSDSILISSSSDSDSDSDDHQTEDATTYASVASSIIGGPNLFAATRLFPTNDDLWLRDSSIPMWGSLFIKDGKSSCVTKRFVFDASAIANLKDMAKSSSSCVQVLERGPTRVEVVSAFIWQCAMAASKQKYGFQRPSVLTHTVNLRSRIFLDDAYEAAAASDTAAAADLNLENSIGNLLWIAAARCPTVMLDEEEEVVVVANNNSSASGSRILHGLVSELRNALSKVDGGFVKKMRSGEEGKSLMLKCLKEIIKTKEEEEEKKDYYGFSSWCKFGLYEAGDFGWGKPIWVSSIASTGNSVFMNLIILVDTKLGDGIEAWVTLDQHHMALLQSNPLLQKYVSFDPTPLLLL